MKAHTEGARTWKIMTVCVRACICVCVGVFVCLSGLLVRLVIDPDNLEGVVYKAGNGSTSEGGGGNT